MVKKAKKAMASTALPSLQAVASVEDTLLNSEQYMKAETLVTDVAETWAWEAETAAVASHNTQRIVKTSISTIIIDVQAPFRTASIINIAGTVRIVNAPAAIPNAAKGG